MNKLNVLFIFCIVFLQSLRAQSAPEPEVAQAVTQMMRAQEAAWNRGDLSAFMEGYWVSDDLVFVGGRGPTYGYENTLASYLKGYPDRAAMGQLRFDFLRMTQWDENTLQLIGRYTLTRQADTPTGYFTLLLRRIEGIWKIVSDHSSAAPQ